MTISDYLVISINDIKLFDKLNTVNNRMWFALIYESNTHNCSSSQEITVYYSNACWESKFFFYDFYTKNKDLKYRIE